MYRSLLDYCERFKIDVKKIWTIRNANIIARLDSVTLSKFTHFIEASIPAMIEMYAEQEEDALLSLITKYSFFQKENGLITAQDNSILVWDHYQYRSVFTVPMHPKKLKALIDAFEAERKEQGIAYTYYDGQ
jgi:hypothetical protein